MGDYILKNVQIYQCKKLEEIVEMEIEDLEIAAPLILCGRMGDKRWRSCKANI